MAQIAVRLPDRLIEAVDAAATDIQTTRSQLVRTALEEYLYRLACERDAAAYDRQPLTDSELALADDPEGWSTTAPW